MTEEDCEGAMAEIVPFDSEARHSLTPEQDQHLGRVTRPLVALVQHKYRQGQLEHGGSCWLKPGMHAHALDEVADLAVYLFTLREQMQTLARKCRQDAVTLNDAADEIERWLVK